MKVFIYVLKHPVTNEIRYVGLTRFPVKRLNNEINYPHTNHLRNWVNSLKRELLKPVMELVEETEEGLACDAERKWIAEMRARGCRLLNFTDGGERGYTYPDEVRAAISAAIRGKKRRPMSDEHKAKISASQKGSKKPWSSARFVELNKSRAGIPLSEETKKKLSEIGKQHVMTEEHRENLRIARQATKLPSKFTDQQKAEIKFLVKEGYSSGVIAEAYGTYSGIGWDIKKGNLWAKVEPAASASILPQLKTLRIRNEKGQYGRVNDA
jgi:hypothetical protein